MAVGAQIDTSERETDNTKIPLLNGDQMHETPKVTGQYTPMLNSRARTRAVFKVNPRPETRHERANVM